VIHSVLGNASRLLSKPGMRGYFGFFCKTIKRRRFLVA
jgi:hypothetical protein